MKKKSKGERLKWQNIYELKEIKLTEEICKGNKVEIKEDKNRKLIIL